MPTPQGDPNASPVQSGSTTLERGWRVLLHNDDVTPFDLVILGLMKACGLSEEVAEMIAVEAHEQGVAVARSGLSQDDAEAMCQRLKALTRIPPICPGVAATAEHE
jgi:ATP-dependent Clp protease adapter protein ClpS